MWQRRILGRIPWALLRWFDPHHYPRYEFIREMAARVGPGDWVLDAGAGECPFRELFAHARYLPVDNRSGDARWDYSGLGLICDLYHPGICAGSIDHIICNDVLEHVPDPAAFIGVLFDLLKPNGNLFLSAPQGWGQHQCPHDYFRFTSYALRMLFEQAGFEVRLIRPLGGFFYYFANRVQMWPIMLFPPVRRRWVEVLRWPLRLAALALFGVLLPLVIMPLDRLDKDRNTTLTYGCWARKPDS